MEDSTQEKEAPAAERHNTESQVGASLLSECLSPASFWQPVYLESSAWLDHAPFAFWLIDAHRPRSVVELGTHGGYSYFAFCQAVQALGADTRCYAVDHWKGDEHAGLYDESIFERVLGHNDAHYATFSRLVRSSFDDALQHFSDGSVDLLHIDGRHFYEDVKHDFESWLPKLSNRAVVLFHDTNVRERGFGVFRLWQEIRNDYPSFEFLHGHGLGVLGYGSEVPSGIRALFAATSDPHATVYIRDAYNRLGAYPKQALQQRKERAKGHKNETALKKKLKERESDGKALSAKLAKQKQELNTLSTKLSARQHTIRKLKNSISWRLTAPLRALSRGFKWLVRNALRAMRLVWWIMTGQCGRAAKALRPYHRRYVPLRVKKMIPNRVRRAVKRRFPGVSVNHSTAKKGGNRAVAKAEAASAAEDWEKAVALWMKVLKSANHHNQLLAERRFTTAVIGLLDNGVKHARVIALLDELKTLLGERKTILAAKGIAYLRAGDMQTAGQIWREYWGRAKESNTFAEAPKLLPPRKPVDNGGLFPTTKKNTALSPYTAPTERICVYTALFGDYDQLTSPLYQPPGIDFICFSDRPRNVSGWEVRIVDPGMDDTVMQNRMVKLLPHTFLPEYEGSIYIDANICFLSDPLLLYRHWLKGKAFVAWRHPKRSDVYEECEAILTAHRCRNPEHVISQYKRFSSMSIPRNVGLIEACFLWRDHRDPAVQRLMDQWWDLLVELGGRDQPVFGYVSWSLGVRPEIMPNQIGPTWINDYFAKFEHFRSAIDSERQHPRKGTANLHGNRSGKESDGSKPLVLTGKKKLVWVYASSAKRAGSTVMRAFQLSEIVEKHLDGCFEVGCVDEGHLDKIADSLVFLTKGFLKNTTPEDLLKLRHSGNILCADYVDDKIRENLHELVDVYIASSIRQYVDYKNSRCDKMVHLITHHCDPRVHSIKGPSDYLNIGYFGEMANAAHRTDLQGVVDFRSVDTRESADHSWIQRLGDCNMHYAVRENRPIDGYKPFLKGFVAANCTANIIVPFSESDSRFYLGSEYPYVLKDDSLASVIEMIGYARDSYGTHEWRRGLEVMKGVKERCSHKRIAEEIFDLRLQLGVGVSRWRW